MTGIGFGNNAPLYVGVIDLTYIVYIVLSMNIWVKCFTMK